MQTRTTLLFISLISILTLRSQTNIPEGDVFGDWYSEGSPYFIEGNIHLAPDQRLKIWPGVQVVFLGQFGFEIEGKIDAAGTQSDSITFTAYDTTGYSEGTFVGWNGLTFLGWNYSFSDSSSMAFCNVEFSQNAGISCMAYPYLNLNNSMVRYNQSSGINLFEFSSIVIRNTNISDNKAQGMVVWSSSPQVFNFIIERNEGSGLTIDGNGSGSLNPLFNAGMIRNNISTGNGGGVSINMDAYPVFSNVEINHNVAINGGGIFCGMSNCILNNVSIHSNHALNGAGIFGDYFSSIQLNFCTVVRNISDQNGGGVYLNEGLLHVQNCTFSSNIAGGSGGGLFYNCEFNSNSNIVNSILWSNSPDEIYSQSGSPLVNYSDVAGGFPGMENIDEDPLFVDPSNNDFHLLWTGFPEETGFKSPCIDAGDPYSSADPDGTNVDMGAWYFHQGVFTAVNDSKEIADVNIFPNPALEFISIESGMDYNWVRIFSLSGQEVFAGEIIGSERVDISGLNAGVYLVQIYNHNDLVKTRKLLKK